MPFLHANGVALHYDDRGDPALPTLVFSNSLGTDFRIWNDVVAGLCQNHRIIRYDKRGHGLSEATPAPYQMADHVADLASLLDQLKTGPSTIIGISVGGMIAQGLAALRPELVAALVLCNTAHVIGTEDMWNQRIETATNSGISSMAGPILERWFTRAFRTSGDPAFTGYHAMLTRTTVDGYAGTCAALRDADLTESARALAVPVLCLVGDEDGSTPPELVKSLSDLIAGSQYEVIRAAGHLPCIEQPAETTRLIAEFLRINQSAIN